MRTAELTDLVHWDVPGFILGVVVLVISRPDVRHGRRRQCIIALRCASEFKEGRRVNDRVGLEFVGEVENSITEFRAWRCTTSRETAFSALV